jgi:hypothetical protein
MRDFAAAQLVELGQSLGTLTIESDAIGAEVQVDGKAIGVVPLGRTLHLEPGSHEVRVTAGERPSYVEKITIAAGKDHAVRAMFTGTQAASSPSPSLSTESSLAKPALASSRTGKFMLNIKLGTSALIYNTPGQSLGHPTLTTSLELGYAICCERFYFVVPISIQWRDAGSGSNLLMFEIPIGLQYDIRLTQSLYLPLQINFGYSFGSLFGGGASGWAHNGTFLAQLGIKYVVKGRGNLGLDLISLPVHFVSNAVALEYRLQAYGGVNF